MNRYTKWIIVAIVVAVIALLTLSSGLVARPIPSPSPIPEPQNSPSGQPKITWSQPVLNFFLLPGDIRLRQVTFTSTDVLKNIIVEAVPEIARFVSINPNTFPTVSSAQPQTVNFSFSVPAGIGKDTQGQQNGPNSYDGTVHVRDGSRTLPQTLKVSITVGVPPDPGAAGMTTLAGIDSDGDGVRDDVQRYIGLTYPQSAKQRAALTQAALALQAELTGASSGAQQLSSALDCVNFTLMTSDADVIGGKNARDTYLSLRAVVLNTPDRAKAFFQADSRLGSVMTLSTPYSQKARRCLFLHAAEQADPLSPALQYEYGGLLISAGRYEEAAGHCRRSSDIAECQGRVLLAEGRIDDAIQTLASAPNTRYLGYAYGRAGRSEEVEKLAAVSRGALQQVLIYAGLGDRDGTLSALDRMTDLGPVRVGLTLTLPELSFLRGDPRVKDLRKKAGLPE